ncbi:MAG: LysM peptidoglycan-binding domain-containing protein [Propionivibrio sp.]|nr:LysM peptidoglycan-binding domain-containing protein [Propionivibrio sp.]
MKIRINTLTAITCIGILAMLSGCTTTGSTDRGTAQSQTTALQSLRLSDVDQSLAAPISGDDSGFARIEIPNQPLVSQAIDLTSDTDDLFLRIRNGFSMPDISNDLVLSHQQWYLNRPDYLRRMVERSGRYMHHIVEEIDKRGMPMELALLPMVESAYNPMALSRSKASGLWQFIPTTGKHFNLDQDWWKDERRDIVASTAAALDYLQSIYEMHGDWQLALASYNWGEGAVGRAIGKNKAQGLPTDYQSLTMPSETRNYVPKLQALKNIFSSPAIMAQLDLPTIPNQPYFATVTNAANIDVKVAAELADMPVQEFVALNPSHNRPVIKSDTPLVIPADKLDTFMSNLEAHEQSNKPLSLWQAYTMQRGDRLDKIAARFGMTTMNLKAINGIRGRAKVSPGVTLLVTRQYDDAGAQEVAALTEQQTLDAGPAQTAKDEPVAVEAATRSYTVRKGDVLATIARKNNLSLDELKRINGLKSNTVKAGRKLALVSSPKKSASAPERKAVKALAASEIKPKARKAETVTRYKVRRGDTLYSIAKQFKVETSDLMRWNSVSAKTLTPGKTLTIQLARNP